MRSPPLAPGFDFETYIVLDDLGKLGRAYREVDEEYADRATVIRNISDGQYSNPVRVVSFNTAEGWSRDVTEDIAASFWTTHTARQSRCPSQPRHSWSGLPVIDRS